MLPGTNRIFMQPAPQRTVADACDQARLTNISRQLGYSPPSQRQVVLRGQFAGQRLNLYDQFWGGKTGGDPVVASLQVPAVAG